MPRRYQGQLGVVQSVAGAAQHDGVTQSVGGAAQHDGVVQHTGGHRDQGGLSVATNRFAVLSDGAEDVQLSV